MAKEIYKAVANLPEELITPQIAAAAIEEGKIELLDYLPKSYLTGEVVMSLIEKNSDSYSYYGFKLSSLPETIRTKEVCEFAVKKDTDNIIHVPFELRSSVMLERMLSCTKHNIKHLHLFPSEAWSVELAIQGVKDIYSQTIYNTGPRGGYRSPTTHTDIKKVQMFLSYVPKGLQDKEFYRSLSTTKLTPEELNIITPDRLKDRNYYKVFAARNFKLVPKQYYGYDLFMIAIENNKISFETPHFSSYERVSTIEQTIAKENHKELMELLFSVMDDKMADKIIETKPYNFKKLPKTFQTPERLIDAIQKCERDDLGIYYEEQPHLFTEDVCKAYVRKNYKMPKLPQSIWSAEFVEYCMEHGTSYIWFEQLPKHLQTLDIVEKAINCCKSYAKYTRPELISPEIAVKLYRDSYYSEYVPQQYIKDFVDETGLNEKFFGGEVSFDTLRDNRSANTYCRVGNTYIGMSSESSYSAVNIVTVTRRTPRSFRPEMVFRQVVKTFHVTWLEKLFADYDPSFTKPTTNKATKPYQTNGYYTVKKVASECGIDIYSNSFLGEVLHYTAIIDEELVEYGSLDRIKTEINEYSIQDCDFGTPVFEAETKVAV